MLFDPENKIIQLCAQGMEMELAKQFEKAKECFANAWNQSESNIEKFVSAHYLARHQSTTEEKLKWDLLSLQYALLIGDAAMQESFASLYLNIGKGYEDLGDDENALENYKAGASFTRYLPGNSYGALIKEGIQKALTRLQKLE